MKTYCMNCRGNTRNIDPKMVRTKNKRLIIIYQISDLNKYQLDLTKKKKRKNSSLLNKV